MVKKTKKSASKSEDSNVVRIKASAPSTKKTVSEEVTDEVVTKTVAKSASKTAKPKAEKKAKKPRKKRGFAAPFRAIGGYFKGAWVELRQVRWPNRRATWGMTFAVLVYSAFFVALILLLDAGFKYLFELIIGK